VPLSMNLYRRHLRYAAHPPTICAYPAEAWHIQAGRRNSGQYFIDISIPLAPSLLKLSIFVHMRSSFAKPRLI
jgi:hypothetical protein